MPNNERLRQIAPDDIRANDENPRTHFPEGPLEALAESIHQVGVLVPISVYEDPSGGPPHFVLIDGERRWRSALRLGLAEIPAIIMPPPEPLRNLLTMFNIHMVREPWADMPTARALRTLIERTGQADTERLVELTGLSAERVKRLKLALDLPQKYQELIDREEVPLNFFWELDRTLIGPLRKERPAIFDKFGRNGILEAFVEKKAAGVTRDTVELRRIPQIIKIARDEAGEPTAPSDLDQAIEELISVRDRTIQETYENTVELVIEAERFTRQCEQLVMRLDRLMDKVQSDEERVPIRTSIRDLVRALSERLERLGEAATVA